MDTIQSISSIQVNPIDWAQIGVMIGILMLGGVLYNTYRAFPYIQNGTFNPIIMAKENWMRFAYSLFVSFLLSFTFNWIPGSDKLIAKLSGEALVFSAVGLLAFGVYGAKLIFSKVKKSAK